MAERLLPVHDAREQRLLFGSLDRNLRAIRERYGVVVSARRGVLRVAGDDDDAVREVARRLSGALSRAREPGDAPTDAEMFALLLDEPAAEPGVAAHDGARRGEAPPSSRRPPARPAPAPEVKPLTRRQAEYVAAIRSHDVVFSIGPAGTGKTYLAVAEAVASLRSGRHRKIILTRPAVEAGEKLGFLPGDFHAKINPYLRPLYDALQEMLRYGEVQRYVDSDVIEIVPLAYMRGRTLKNAFIILDEAQNTTPAQMKMFLTRLGEDSKIVVTGDVTQVDLPAGATSGLIEVQRILAGVSGLAFVEFRGEDILRHALVQRIVDAYEREEARRREASGPPPGP